MWFFKKLLEKLFGTNHEQMNENIHNIHLIIDEFLKSIDNDPFLTDSHAIDNYPTVSLMDLYHIYNDLLLFEMRKSYLERTKANDETESSRDGASQRTKRERTF